jgi:ketosteroid isomerase-like protein
MNQSSRINNLFAVAFLIFTMNIAAAADSSQDNAKAAEDVQKAFYEVEAAHKSGDVDTLSKHVYHEYDWFAFAGYDLETSTVGVNKEKLAAAFKAGLAFDWKVENLRVNVYGDSAVTTCIFRGTVTTPGGKTQSGVWRDSNFWTKTDSGWKIVHSHVSPLTEAVSQNNAPRGT